MMRIPLTALNVSGGRWHWPWSRGSWKGWLYLAIFVFISGRLFVGQGFSITLTPNIAGKTTDSPKTDTLEATAIAANIDRVAAKHGDRSLKMAETGSTWSSSPVSSGQVPKDDRIVVDYLSISSTSEGSDYIAGGRNNQQPGNVNVIDSSLGGSVAPSGKVKSRNDDELLLRKKQQERRYWLRSERVKQVCQARGVVAYPPLFTTHKNESKPDYTYDSTTRPRVSAAVETPVTSHFSLAPSFQTMGCFLNKVASSSLVSAFLVLHGLGPTFTSPHSYAFRLYPRTLEDFYFSNHTFFKFMFVRHPMDRMLSCYLDKMVESPHLSLPPFRKYVKTKARQILQRRRKQSQQLNSRFLYDSPKSAALRRNLLSSAQQQGGLAPVLWNRPDDVQTVYGRRMEEEGNDELNNRQVEVHLTNERDAIVKPTQARPFVTIAPNVLGKQPAEMTLSAGAKVKKVDEKPTFEEFLEFVLDTDLQGNGYDSHWVPFHRYCSPCSVPYHVIGKLETAAEDFQYIWSRTGLDTKVPVPWINRITVPSKSKMALEKQHYASLPRELILRFYEAFRMDFEMFDYSINDVLLKAGYEPIEEYGTDNSDEA